jgi:hypothetical protein
MLSALVAVVVVAPAASMMVCCVAGESLVDLRYGAVASRCRGRRVLLVGISAPVLKLLEGWRVGMQGMSPEMSLSQMRRECEAGTASRRCDSPATLPFPGVVQHPTIHPTIHLHGRSDGRLPPAGPGEFAVCCCTPRCFSTRPQANARSPHPDPTRAPSHTGAEPHPRSPGR